MNRFANIIILLLALLPCFAYAQSLSFKTYTVSDGLVANPVRCIYQDSKGFIWIGTFAGLSRYDGYKFTNYTTNNGLSHDFINSMIEVNGNLLIAENNGAIDIIKNNNFQKRLTVPSAISVVQPYKDRLLVTTDDHGFYEYRNDTIISPVQQQPGTPVGQFIGINDTLLIADGLVHNVFLYKDDLTIKAILKTPNVTYYSLFRDSKKRIWACTTAGLKLFQIAPGQKKPIVFAALPTVFNFSPLNNAPVTSMIEEKDGSFWFGTVNGLVRLFPDGNFHVYNEKDGLPSAGINTLYRDKENNLWIGTTLGLAKWVSKNRVDFYNTVDKDFKNNILNIFPSDPGKILLKTNSGLQLFYPYTKEFKIAVNSYCTPITASSSSLVHYSDKIGILDTNRKSIVPVETLDTIINGAIFACKHPDKTIFVGTFGGLYAIKKSSVKKILPYRITGLVVNRDGVIWVGTWQNGLFRLVAKSNEDSNYEIRDVTHVINQIQIRGLYTDSKKNIWVGTRYGGAFCVTDKAGSNFEVQHFNRQSGLMSDWVNGFAETNTGDMWIGTYLGLDRLVKKQSGYRVFNFSKAVNFFADIKTIVTTNDIDWICVANTGIAHFKDENIHQTAPLQATILSSSHGVLENKLMIAFPTEKIFLRTDQNAARFEFSALGFINEKQIMYSYRLKGSSDTLWSKPENIHEASYASLSPGPYTFEVRTIGWNGEPGKATAYSFTIATPFWKQWWFIALCVLVIVALIYSLYRYRIRQIMRLQQVRNTIATDLHDDIGSALTNISILAELSRNKNQQNVFSENLPGRISEESTLAQQALDDIIWSVNSNNDNLNQTMARMRRYAAEVFEPVGINCKIDFESIPVDHKLNMEQRKDIYLVFKECLNNIIKHASAKNVFIKIDLERNLFKLKIEDDGKGFDTSSPTERNGVKNIGTRVQRWNGKLAIHSSISGGTTVDCSFPLASPK